MNHANPSTPVEVLALILEREKDPRDVCSCDLQGRRGLNAYACGLYRLVWSDGTGPTACDCRCLTESRDRSFPPSARADALDKVSDTHLVNK